MAVEDQQTQRPTVQDLIDAANAGTTTQQPGTGQRLIDAAQTGATIGAGTAVVAAPAVAPTIPAVVAGKIAAAPVHLAWDAAKVAILLRVLRRLFARQKIETAGWLERELKRRYPNVDIAVIRQAVEREHQLERIFQAKSLRRVEADAHAAGLLPTPEQQRARMQAILNREKHYVGLREKAMLDRATAACENWLVKQESPLGAKWMLGPRKNHTRGCLALAGKAWPWAVLDVTAPPIHAGCGCFLAPLRPGDHVLDVGAAMHQARRALALEEAVREVADEGEIDAYLAGEPVRPSIERALQRIGNEVFQQGEWLTLDEAQAPPTGAMVALYPSENVASKLALKGGEPQDEIHLTLAFLGKADKLPDPEALKQAVADWAARTPPIEGEIAGHGLFTAGPEPVTYVSPDLPGLPEARADLVDALDAGEHPLSRNHGFTPHMTIAYTDRVGDMPDHGGRKLSFPKASLVIGPERHDFEFAGVQEAVYEERLHPRGRSGRWVNILGKLKAAKMDDITDVEGHTVIRTKEGYSVRVGAGKRAEGHDPAKIANAIEQHLEHRASLGEPMTLDNMDANYQKWFSPQKLDGGKEAHPRSGYEVHVGKWRAVQQPQRDTDGPPIFKVTDYGEHAGDQPFPKDAGTEPIREAYRGMTIEEWNQAVERGYIQSDLRGVIAGWEGTNAGVDPQTAHSYLPRNGESVIAKMEVRPEDQWFTRNEDGYLRTRERIPIDRVKAVSPVIYKEEHEGTFVRPDSTSAAKLTTGAEHDRSREATGGGAPGSGGGGRGDLVRFTAIDASTEEGYQRYISALRDNPHAEFITEPSREELAAKRVWLSEDGKVGVTISPDGEIGNLFRNPGAVHGAGGQALDHAIANGGTWLNCFDGALPEIYAKHGFGEVARLKFNPDFKPEGWDLETQDHPDILFMGHNVTEYRGHHRAPSSNYGAPMHDMTRQLPEDFYDKATQLQYYGSGEPRHDRESLRAINAVRGKPDAPVTIHRAVPSGVHEIHGGDWVTPSRSYAQAHTDRIEGGGHVISREVRAGELWSTGDELNEFGWQPEQGYAQSWDEAEAEVLRAIGALEEASIYTEVLHPRDRLGRWLEKHHGWKDEGQSYQTMVRQAVDIKLPHESEAVREHTAKVVLKEIKAPKGKSASTAGKVKGEGTEKRSEAQDAAAEIGKVVAGWEPKKGEYVPAAGETGGQARSKWLASLYEVAKEAHGDQTDKRGKPYMEHVLAVADSVSNEAKPVALFHDALEDTHMTPERLKAALIEPKVTTPEEAQTLVDAIGLMTHDPADTYDEYVEKIATAEGKAGELAREVKRADLQHNVGRLTPELEDKRPKYEQALQRLARPVERVEQRGEAPEEWLDPEVVKNRFRELIKGAQERGVAADQKHWYQTAHDQIWDLAEEHNVDSHALAAMVAATSPQMTWELEKKDTGIVEYPNLDLAVRSLKAAREYPDMPAPALVDHLLAINDLGGLGTSVEKAVRLSRGEDPNLVLNAPKTRSFYNNLAWPQLDYSATIDAHMGRATLGTVGKSDYAKATKHAGLGDILAEKTSGGKVGQSGYKWVADRVIEVAHEMGWLPHEAQAVIWVQQKYLSDELDAEKARAKKAEAAAAREAKKLEAKRKREAEKALKRAQQESAK